MKKSLVIILIFSSITVFGQEEKDIQLQLSKESETKLPQIIAANDDIKGPEKPEPPAYIYDTHLPPASKKKEMEEAERRFYTRPVLNLPQAHPQEN